MLRLYDYAASGNCFKVRLLLSYLGIRYERVGVDIFGGETLTVEHARRNPMLTTPVLEYEPGRYLPESGAILLFLAEGADLLPENREARAQIHRWLFFEQSTVLPAIAMPRFLMATGRAEPGSPQMERGTRMANAVTLTIDRQMREREFVAAEHFTIADIALYGYMHVAHEAGVDTSELDGLNGWLDRVRAQPGHIDDLQPYPANARPGAGRSIWDALA